MTLAARIARLEFLRDGHSDQAGILEGTQRYEADAISELLHEVGGDL